MDHPNIVKFYEVYEERKNIFLVMEHCSAGDLYQALLKEDHFSEELTAKILIKIFKSVNYLHKYGICHRDLKLQNILFKDDQFNEPKLIDFGLSTEFKDNENLKSILGTPLYVAPEVLSNL